MNFKPCSDQEIADSKLWAKADYPFEILDAEEKTSQEKGNPMFELTVRITRPDGAHDHRLCAPEAGGEIQALLRRLRSAR